MNEPATLALRDIHLPEAISWWPIAPGWWMIAASIIFIVTVFIIIKKMYARRQLKREINAELNTIKEQFQSLPNKSQLAKSLSILLRRASISYYPKNNIAGLTGNDWLAYLDKTNKQSSSKMIFQSDVGEILLSAPYLPENSEINFDENALLNLCESWLLSPHKPNKSLQVAPS